MSTSIFHRGDHLVRYLAKEDRNFKTFLKENNSVALALLWTLLLNMELNVMLIVLMELAYIGHSLNFIAVVNAI